MAISWRSVPHSNHSIGDCHVASLLAIITGKPTTMNEKMTGAGAPKTLLPGRSCRQSALRNRLVTEEEFGRQCADIEHCQTSTCAVSCDRPASKPEDSADFQIPARIPLPTRYFLAYARAGHLKVNCPQGKRGHPGVSPREKNLEGTCAYDKSLFRFLYSAFFIQQGNPMSSQNCSIIRKRK